MCDSWKEGDHRQYVALRVTYELWIYGKKLRAV